MTFPISFSIYMLGTKNSLSTREYLFQEEAEELFTQVSNLVLLFNSLFSISNIYFSLYISPLKGKINFFKEFSQDISIFIDAERKSSLPFIQFISKFLLILFCDGRI